MEKKTTLRIKRDRKSLFVFELKQCKEYEDTDLYLYVGDIRKSWLDIEYLNYSFHKLFGIIMTKHEDEITTEACETILLSLYTHLDIIRNVYKDRLSQILNKTFTETLIDKKDTWKKIAIARNNIVTHKEKNDFIRPVGIVSGTDDDGFFSFELDYRDKDGKYKKIKLTPLTEAKEVLDFLEDLKDKFNSFYV